MILTISDTKCCQYCYIWSYGWHTAMNDVYLHFLYALRQQIRSRIQTPPCHTFSLSFLPVCQEALAHSSEKGAVCTLIPSNPPFHSKWHLWAAKLSPFPLLIDGLPPQTKKTTLQRDVLRKHASAWSVPLPAPTENRTKDAVYCKQWALTAKHEGQRGYQPIPQIHQVFLDKNMFSQWDWTKIFSSSDDEVRLLLEVTLNHKPTKSKENVDSIWSHDTLEASFLDIVQPLYLLQPRCTVAGALPLFTRRWSWSVAVVNQQPLIPYYHFPSTLGWFHSYFCTCPGGLWIRTNNKWCKWSDSVCETLQDISWPHAPSPSAIPPPSKHHDCCSLIP